MERLFHEDWAQKFRWAESCGFQTWPQYPAQELLHGQALRTAGRSPAVDVCTDGARAQALRPVQLLQDALVNRCNDHERLRKGWRSRLLCHALFTNRGCAASAGHHHRGDSADSGWPHRQGWRGLEGPTPKSENGLESLDLPALHFCLNKHEGHLPDSCGPRLRRRLQAALPSIVRACPEFMLRSDCEHVARPSKVRAT